MDSTQEILKLVDLLSNQEKTAFRTGVFSHIERAEFYFNLARKNSDDQYYTDIIYRTNHAYEGVLREVYAYHSKKDSKKIETYKIEEYFEKESLFNSRVKKLFMQYRTDWRNPSTHDHRASFDQNEAFLAILSVSGFIYVLLNQLIQLSSYKTAKSTFVETGDITIYSSLYDKIVNVLTTFSEKIHETIPSISYEAQLLGFLQAYLEKQESKIKIQTDFCIPDKSNLRPDLVVFQDGAPSIVIELKLVNRVFNEKAGIEQLLNYLTTMRLNRGILFYFNDQNQGKYETKVCNFGEFKITVINGISKKSSK